jgi:radical SAM superfamily enzyme YgiQ (UPF0313 family)
MNLLLLSAPRLPGLKASRGTLPVSLLHLSAALRDAGHSPSILDLSVVEIPVGVSPDDYYRSLVFEKIRELSPGYVGINCFSSMHFPFIIKLFREIKSMAPDVRICLGGAHPTFYFREILENCPGVDFIVLGEGEEQAVALADAIATQETKSFQDIQSFAYRGEEDNEICINPRVSYINDLDSLATPAYDLITMTDYYTDHSNWYNPKNRKINLSVPILTTRSCPFNCNFCSADSIMGKKLRRRNPIKVVDEIEILVREFGQNYFTFVDDNVNLNKNHFITLCEQISNRNIDIQMSVSQGMYLNSVDEDVVRAFVNAGGVTVCAPIESGSSYIRNKVIGKNLSNDTIKNSIRLFQKYNLFTIGLFIMGFEEDTATTLDKTLAMIEQLNLDVNAVSTLVPFPGTKIYSQARQNNSLLFDETEIWNGETFFDPQNKKQFFIKPNHLSLTELMTYRERFDSLYFFSKRAKSLNSLP